MTLTLRSSWVPRWDGLNVGVEYQKKQERVRLAPRHRTRNALAAEQWPWREVLLFLKAGSRAFSFHDIQDPILHGIAKRVLYPPQPESSGPCAGAPARRVRES